MGCSDKCSTGLQRASQPESSSAGMMRRSKPSVSTLDKGDAAQQGMSPLKVADGSHVHEVLPGRGKAAEAAACQGEPVHAVATVGHPRSLLSVAERCIDEMHRVCPQVGHVLLQVTPQSIEGRLGGL